MEIEYFFFVLLGFTASMVSAVFGFGTALIVLAIGSHILPVKEAIALGTVLFAASTTIKTLLYCKHIDWKIAGVMSLASLPFAYLGASFVNDIPADFLMRLLGAMILLYLALSIFNLFPAIKVGKFGLIAGSASYGFVSGLLGSGNLIKAIIFREMKLSKEAFVGVMAATSVLANIAKLTAYTQSGLLSVKLLWPILGLILGAISAALLGQRMLRKLSLSHYELGIQFILAISAIALMI